MEQGRSTSQIRDSKTEGKTRHSGSQSGNERTAKKVRSRLKTPRISLCERTKAHYGRSRSKTSFSETQVYLHIYFFCVYNGQGKKLRFHSQNNRKKLWNRKSNIISLCWSKLEKYQRRWMSIDLRPNSSNRKKKILLFSTM